jgi:hypothetical protein
LVCIPHGLCIYITASVPGRHSGNTQ